jgi:hypothetical protein
MDDLNNNYIIGENHDKYDESLEGSQECHGACGEGGQECHGACGEGCQECHGGCGEGGQECHGGCGEGCSSEGSQEGINNLLIKSINNNSILNELFINQLKNINPQKKLSYCDIQRISKFLKASIFGNTCSLWTGYITNDKNINKGVYINFYYNKKKIALHRLLYANYVGEISDKEYIKYNCVNKGKCCNIHHMSKFTYKKNNIVNSKSKISNVQQIDTSLTLEI